MGILILTGRAREFEAVLARAELTSRSEVVTNVAAGLRRLEEAAWELVVLDAGLSGGATLELVEPLSLAGRLVVVTAAEPTLALTLRVLRSGGRDVLSLPPPAERLRELAEEAAGAAVPLPAASAAAESWVGAGAALLETFRSAARLASADTPVLLQGEPGTGRELLARAIHEQSGRSAGPFVTVNCGALPESVLESELFGHEQGAVPGAYGRRTGRITKADGGTLFLDELQELGPRLQLRLVKLLREGVVEPLGADAEQRVSVRLMASIDRTPAVLLEAGTLHPDLHAELAAGLVVVPPLRERGEEEIRRLAEHCIAEYAQRYGRTVRGVSEDAWSLLLHHPWPGNMRQMRGVLERAVVHAGDGVIHVSDLPPELQRRAQHLTGEPDLSLADVERRHIARVLELADGHLGRTADLLGIHRNTLRRKLQVYGIETD